MVGRNDWFRQTKWNEPIAAEFWARLARARRKEQYLRIQASYLTESHPEAALVLLDRYLSMPEQFDQAQAHMQRAEAFLTLGRTTEALDAYEAALRREADFPNVKTQAYLRYTHVIALRRIASRYSRALEILDARKEDLTFPVDRFLWHATRAFIFSDQGKPEAESEARAALEFASVDRSGFRHHPKVGLVGKHHDETIERLKKLR